MASEQTFFGVSLRVDENILPGEQPELIYRFTNTANEAWTLARIKGFPQADFGGHLVIETNAGGGVPGDTTTERLRIDQNGNIGLGKLPDASYRLDVNGILNATDIHKNGAPLQVSQWDDVTGGINYAGGNVGIGTTTLNDKLTVTGGDIRIEGGRYRRLKIVSDQYWAGIELVAREQGEAGNPHIDFTHGDLDVPNYGIRLYAPDNNNFVIEGGNVGIGVTNPYTQLTLSGSIGFTNATTPMMYIYQSGTNNPERPIIAHSPPYSNWGISYRDSVDTMIFQSAGTPVMAVALGGQRVGIGTTDPNVKLHVVGNRIRLTNAGNANQYIDLRADGSALDLESSTDLYLNNNGKQVYYRNLKQVSSRELKEMIADLPGEEAANLLEALNPVRFVYKDDSNRQPQLGFIAEDVPSIIAPLDRKGIDPMSIIAVLCGVVREQQKKVATLQEEIQWLKGQLK